MQKYKLSETDAANPTTIFLERDGYNLICPYRSSYDAEGIPSDCYCGDWCPLFSIEESTVAPIKTTVYLLCGSGNAAYQIES